MLQMQRGGYSGGSVGSGPLHWGTSYRPSYMSLRMRGVGLGVLCITCPSAEVAQYNAKTH